ncbi:MAG: hypothetical protein A2Y33_00725 [Spirochaetes bacterium GWF1_51_8]|nr:MAG: hypothetical protein A2Y33_00725 [Spirochaetes bacterium GWF1_51_8]
MDKELIEKIERRPLELNDEDFRALRDLYRNENGAFRRIMKRAVGRIRGKNDLPVVGHLYRNLTDELIDISPFLSQEFNRLFRSVIDWGIFKSLAELDALIAACGNPQLLAILKEQVIVRTDLYKYINNLEIYKIKKTVHDLAVKFNKMDDIVVKLEMELSAEDMNWMDFPE